eukprot:5803733-Alexandrium_andersonii.AAC.1
MQLRRSAWPREPSATPPCRGEHATAHAEIRLAVACQDEPRRGPPDCDCHASVAANGATTMVQNASRSA